MEGEDGSEWRGGAMVGVKCCKVKERQWQKRGREGEREGGEVHPGGERG